MGAQGKDRLLWRQVEELGNLVRGLQLVVERLRADPDGRAIRTELGPAVCRILSRLPAERRPADLVGELRQRLHLDGLPDPPAPVQQPNAVRNAVIVPLVEEHPRPAGLVRELSAQPMRPYSDAAQFPSEADGEFREALVEGCREAQRLLEDAGVLSIHQLPEDYEFHLEPGPFRRNPELRESSAWLAAALSHVAFSGGLPLPGVIAATGYLDAGGRIGRLQHVKVKIEACLRERPDVDMILVLSEDKLPAAYRNHPKVQRVGTFDEAVRAVWGAEWAQALRPPKLDVYAAMDRAKHAYAKEHDLWGALTRFTLIRRFLEQEPQISERFRFRCDWRIASCHTHLGDPKKARSIFEHWAMKAESLWRDGTIDTEDYANFFASYGVCLQREGALSEAEKLLRDVLGDAIKFRAPRLEQARLLATLGNMLMRKGNYPEAAQRLREAYNLVDGEEKPKYCTFLCRLYVEWGQINNAEQYFREFEKLNGEVTLPTEQVVNRWFNEKVQRADDPRSARRASSATVGSGQGQPQAEQAFAASAKRPFSPSQGTV